VFICWSYGQKTKWLFFGTRCRVSTKIFLLENYMTLVVFLIPRPLACSRLNTWASLPYTWFGPLLQISARLLQIREVFGVFSCHLEPETMACNYNRLRPFFRDHPGEPVPEENFWTLWYKWRLTEADTPTIRLCAVVPTATIPHFYRPDALPAAQPTMSKHWRQLAHSGLLNGVTCTVSVPF